MTSSQAINLLSKKYEMDWILGPITKADYLIYGAWTLASNVKCAEGVIRVYDGIYLDRYDGIYVSNTFKYYKTKHWEKILNQIDKLLEDYRRCLKVQKMHKVQKKIDKIKEMF
jgi:hypothetical protein